MSWVLFLFVSIYLFILGGLFFYFYFLSWVLNDEQGFQVEGRMGLKPRVCSDCTLSGTVGD